MCISGANRLGLILSVFVSLCDFFVAKPFRGSGALIRVIRVIRGEKIRSSCPSALARIPQPLRERRRSGRGTAHGARSGTVRDEEISSARFSYL